MKYSDVKETLKDIGQRCHTPEDVDKEIARLSPADKFKIIHSTTSDDFFEGVRRYALDTVDFLDQTQLVNDYSTGTSKREPMLGILTAVSRLYQQSTCDQGRRELQIQHQDTQYAVSNTTYASDLADTLVKVVQEIVVTETEYHAILKGRSCSIHYTDNEGNYESYSQEEIDREQAIQDERDREYEETLSRMRKVHSDNYWGHKELPEIEPGGTAQTIIPLWETGFTPEKAKEEPALAGSSGVGFS